MGQRSVPAKLQVWIDARRRFHLSHAQVQMARELGMNPKKLGSLHNHDQERWKAPLPQFIERLYFERFGREVPEVVVTIEDRARHERQRKEERKRRRALQREPGAEGAERGRGDNPLPDCRRIQARRC